MKSHDENLTPQLRIHLNSMQIFLRRVTRSGPLKYLRFSARGHRRRRRGAGGLPPRQLGGYADCSTRLPQAGLFTHPVDGPLLGARHHFQATGCSPEQDRPAFCFPEARDGEEGVGNGR